VHEAKKQVKRSIHNSPILRLSEDPLVLPDPFELPPLIVEVDKIGKNFLHFSMNLQFIEFNLDQCQVY